MCYLFFKKLLKINLWPNIWSIIENILCSLERNVYSGVECSIAKTSFCSVVVVVFVVQILLLINLFVSLDLK